VCAGGSGWLVGTDVVSTSGGTQNIVEGYELPEVRAEKVVCGRGRNRALSKRQINLFGSEGAPAEKCAAAFEEKGGTLSTRIPLANR